MRRGFGLLAECSKEARARPGRIPENTCAQAGSCLQARLSRPSRAGFRQGRSGPDSGRGGLGTRDAEPELMFGRAEKGRARPLSRLTPSIMRVQMQPHEDSAG